MKLYKDLGDVARKLLNDDFSTDNQVKLTTKSTNGLSFTLNGKSTAKSTASTGELTMKKTTPSGAKLTTKLSTSKQPTFELQHDTLSPSTALKRSVTVTTNGTDALNIKAHTIAPMFSISADADATQKTATMTTTAAYTPSKYAGFAVLGLSGKVAQSGSVTQRKVAASLFDGAESEVHIEGKIKDESVKQVGAVTVSYSQRVREGVSVAGSIEKVIGVEGSSEVSAVTAVKLDPVTMVKAKVSTTGSVGLVYAQQMRPHTHVTFASSFNAATMDAPKVGFSIVMD